MKKKEELSYKDAYNRLEQIQDLIENNQLDLDELSDTLKEADSLLKLCKNKLFTVNEETKKILTSLNE